MSRVAANFEDGGAVFLEEEAEPEVPHRDGIAAGMLLASVVYMMATLGMASQMKDQVLRKLTLSALNTKISIFIAVLMYQAIKGLFAADEEEGTPSWGRIALTFLGVFSWFCALQVLMVSINFKIFNWTWKIWVYYTKNLDGKKNQDRFEQIWEEEREKLFEFWATLMGHVVGFACIDAFASLQARMYHNLPAYGAWLAIPFAIVGMCAWYFLIKKFRRHITPHLTSRVNEEEIEKKVERLEEAAEDTENDAIALTISFLVCQAFRLAITGTLPNGEGLPERYASTDHNHTEAPGVEPAFGGPLAQPRTYGDIFYLWLMAFLVLVIVLIWRDCACFNKMKECLSEERIERITEVSSDIASMTIAWASFFGMLWLLDTVNQRHCSFSKNHFNCGSGGMTGSVLLALCCTLLAYLLIIIIHWSAGRKPWMDKTTNVIWHDLTASALKAQGLLIGFSWEKSFDLAVEDISDKVDPASRQMYRVGVSFFVCVMVALVWKLFLLPQVMHFKKEDWVVETARKAFKKSNERRGNEMDRADYVETNDQNGKERVELKKHFQKTLDAYIAATKKENDRALTLKRGVPMRSSSAPAELEGGRAQVMSQQEGEAQKAITMLNNHQCDGMKAGEKRAKMFNIMSQVLRRYEEIEIVEDE